MKFETVKKVTMAGLVLTAMVCILGIVSGGSDPQLTMYMSYAALVIMLFTLAIVLKWGRCPWCGALLIRKMFSLKVCPSCNRDLVTGKKKKGKGGRR